MTDRVADSALSAGLASLPPLERQTLVLAYFEHKTYKQIAEDLAIPAPAVRDAAARALRGLARFLELTAPRRP